MKEITKEQLAEELNGFEYGGPVDAATVEKAKANNLVIVFGASDDLVEFEGAIYDEVGLYGKGDIALLLPGDKFEVDGETSQSLQHVFVLLDDGAQPETNRIITAEYTDGGYFEFETSMLHNRFNVVEDGEPAGYGLVIDLDEIQ